MRKKGPGLRFIVEGSKDPSLSSEEGMVLAILLDCIWDDYNWIGVIIIRLKLRVRFQELTFGARAFLFLTSLFRYQPFWWAKTAC